MSPETTKPHKPFTNVTWADFGTSYANRAGMDRVAQYWDAQADLAHELHGLIPTLPIDSCRTLVSAIGNGLPILVTRTDGRREIGNAREFYPTPNSALYLETWGFTLRIRLCDIASVEAATANSID